MAYSAELEARIDKATGHWGLALTKKKMFSGLSYFLYGNMCFAIRGEELLLRLDDAGGVELVKLPGVHAAVMGARIMKNWVQAGGEAIADDPSLLRLLSIGRDYVLRLPPKQ